MDTISSLINLVENDIMTNLITLNGLTMNYTRNNFPSVIPYNITKKDRVKNSVLLYYSTRVIVTKQTPSSDFTLI